MFLSVIVGLIASESLCSDKDTVDLRLILILSYRINGLFLQNAVYRVP